MDVRAFPELADGVGDRIRRAQGPGPGPTTCSVKELCCQYRGQVAPALAGVSLPVARGTRRRSSASRAAAKSTLLRAIVGLHAPRTGTLRFEGRELAPHARQRLRRDRRDIQSVFQDPDSSFNPTRPSARSSAVRSACSAPTFTSTPRSPLDSNKSASPPERVAATPTSCQGGTPKEARLFGPRRHVPSLLLWTR